MSETPLGRKFRRLIKANGPIGVGDYMAQCLDDPEHGFYMAQQPFGPGGSFVTAPEVSQMFGEILGAWLVNTWRITSSPSGAHLVELGPGRGTLMADILRVAKREPAFLAAVTIHLVETSPTLRARQAEALGQHECAWHDSLATVPDGPLFLVANEFFDALPIRQFVRAAGAWRERVVGLDAEQQLGFGIGPGQLRDGPDADDGAILELRPAGEALAAELAGRLAAHGGAALIIDYGHATSALGDTLQAVRNHSYVDPLAEPGEADISAHVDFAALARSAEAAGAAAHGPITQADFLLKLGLLERAGRLGAAADEATRAALQAAVDRLAGADQMGRLFEVMALTRRDLVPPPFVN